MSPLLESERAYECIGQKIIAEMLLKWLPELDHKSCAAYYRFSCNTYCLMLPLGAFALGTQRPYCWDSRATWRSSYLQSQLNPAFELSYPRHRNVNEENFRRFQSSGI